MGKERKRFSLIPAAIVLLLREREVLLQLRSNTGYRDGYWASAVAGHVELGESVIETAVREAREEIGITIRPANLVPLTVMHFTDGSRTAREQRVNWYFRCETWSGEPRIKEPEKCAELCWFSIENPPHHMPPEDREVLRALAAGQLTAVTMFGFDARVGESCAQDRLSADLSPGASARLSP